MKKARHFTVHIVLGICFLLVVGDLLRSKPGFTVRRISSPFEPSSRWMTDPLNAEKKQELRQIFAQDFHYLGSGAQCYAFISEDGNFVLKFFKTKHLVPKKWLKWVPLPSLADYKYRKIDRHILRHLAVFTSYKLAYVELKKETGVIFVHLNKTTDLKTKVNLYDRSLKKYALGLDRYEFVLQKKAVLVRDRIATLMQKEGRRGAIRAIEALLKLVENQCKKGYVDRDSGVSNNYGFIGEDVIHFDVGEIVFDPAAKEPSYYQHEVLRVAQKLEQWLMEVYPELIEEVEKVVNSMMDLDLPGESAL